MNKTARVEGEVFLSLEGHQLRVQAEKGSPGTKYAFSFFRNGKRIHFRGFDTEPFAVFEDTDGPALYRVRADFLSPLGEKRSRESNVVFCDPWVFPPKADSRSILEGGAGFLEGPLWRYPVLLFHGTGPGLFVLMSGAVDRDRQVLPVFHRAAWANRFPGSVLCVADPTLTLSSEMRVGWYLGTGERDATKELAGLVAGVADQLCIPRHRVVFYGSSAGGFGALALARVFRSALAVAVNPQTDLLSYHARRAVELMKKICFPGCDDDDIRAGHRSRLDMTMAWRDDGGSRAILVQNILDIHHYESHFMPLWQALGGQPEGGWTWDGRHHALLYEDPRGHAAEPEEMIVRILDLVEEAHLSLRVP